MLHFTHGGALNANGTLNSHRRSKSAAPRWMLAEAWVGVCYILVAACRCFPVRRSVRSARFPSGSIPSIVS
eukprot:3758000-Alexandrium_andersonii.AAC.1